MGMARLADAPVLLVADIDRGGVFASVYGTIKLLTPEEQARVKGVVINKFRGDAEILKPGLKTLEELTGVPVLGVVPFLDIDLDDEDSVTERFNAKASDKPLDIAVLRLPRISNFTDFNALSRLGPVGLRYVRRSEELGSPDLVILPGTKNTMGDLKWLYQTGLADAVKVLALAGTPGDRHLRRLPDARADAPGPRRGGGGRRHGRTGAAARRYGLRAGQGAHPASQAASAGWRALLPGLPGAALRGYEIHMGKTALSGGGPFSVLSGGVPVGAAAKDDQLDGAVTKDGPPGRGRHKRRPVRRGRLWECLRQLSARPSRRRAPASLSSGCCSAGRGSGYVRRGHPLRRAQERQYDLLAASLRSALDFSAIYEIMGIARH